jgi:hypothetical protein
MSDQKDFTETHYLDTIKATIIFDLQREQREEIVRQDVKWGDQTGLRNGTGGPLLHMLSKAIRELTQSLAASGQCTWLNILEEEVREAFAEDDPALIYAELGQVVAVCVQWQIALLKQIAAGRTPDQDVAEDAMERGFRSILNAVAKHPMVAEVHYKDMSEQTANPDDQITGILEPGTLWQGPFGWGEIFRERDTRTGYATQTAGTDEAWPPHNPYISPGVEPEVSELDAIEQPAEDDDSALWTIAAYSGSCSGCGEEIEPGDEIRAGQDGWEGRCCEL